ncbi:MAG: hypothetical protein ABI685_10040 [Ferruginibacter sp.]
MQQLKHKQFTTVLTGTQVWHEQSSLPIRYCYVPATTGFAAIGSMSNNDKKRPWIER